jgi:hypothetical protein
MVDQFDNGSYYTVRGSDWKVTDISTNASAVINNAIGNTTSGGLIFIRVGLYHIDSSIIIAKHGITLEGEGTSSNNGTVLMGEAGNVNVVVLQPVSGEDILAEVTIKNLGICGNDYTDSGDLISTSGFAGTAKCVFKLRLEQVTFRYIMSSKEAVHIINPEHFRMVDCYIYCLANNSKGVLLESNGFASGPMEIRDSQFLMTSGHSNVTFIDLKVTATSMKRLLCEGNTFNSAMQDNVTAVSIENAVSESGHFYFISNWFHNCKYGVYTDPAMAEYLYDVQVLSNDISYFRNPVETGNTQIYLDYYAVKTIISQNHFQGVSGVAGSVGIDDDGRDVAGFYNKIEDNNFWYIETPIQVNTGTVIHDNLGFVSENSGSIANVTTATFSFLHGLVSTPTNVQLSFNTTAVSSYTWTANATAIDVTVTCHNQIFVPYNAKIADITHADTNHHTVTLGTNLSETRQIVAVILTSERQAGTGDFIAYPNGGGWTAISIWKAYPSTISIAAGTGNFEYSLGAANDDFDLYCMGYWVEAYSLPATINCYWSATYIP